MLNGVNPAERILPVGAPKVDAYVNYEAKVSRKQFHRLFGLDASRKTILLLLNRSIHNWIPRWLESLSVKPSAIYLNMPSAHDHQLLGENAPFQR